MDNTIIAYDGDKIVLKENDLSSDVEDSMKKSEKARDHSDVQIRDGTPKRVATIQTTELEQSNFSKNYSNNVDERSTIEPSNQPYYGMKPAQNTLDSQKANQYRKLAIAISFISIIVTLIICITEFIVSSKEQSAAAYGLAFSAVLDLLSSSVVLWRYYKSYDTFSMHRENVACVVLGVLFVMSAITIGFKASYNLSVGQMPNVKSANGVSVLVTTSAVSASACLVLMVGKIYLSKKLSSTTLLTDAFNSLAAAIVALSIVITSEITEHKPHLWYLDSMIGLIVTFLLLVYGLWLLWERIPQIRSRR